MPFVQQNITIKGKEFLPFIFVYGGFIQQAELCPIAHLLAS